MRRLSVALLLLTCSFALFGQGGAIDSLNKVLRSQLPDTSRVKTLLDLAAQYYRTDLEEARSKATEAKELAEKIGYKSGLAKAYKAIGMSHYNQNNWVETLVNWKLSLETFRSINDLAGVSNILNNLGAVNFTVPEA